MSKQLITGFYYDLGGREILEDRANALTLTTAGNLNLTVAIIADGVGGRDKGERAAQLAIDTVLASLQAATEPDVPTILQRAVKAANHQVYLEGQRTPDRQEASTTLAIAVVQDNVTLFIANVGDSRVYLIRNDNVHQLTIDHTFANIMPMQGKMSWDLARENPRAHVVMRALGPRADIPVDIGFYVNITDPEMATARGYKGLPLKEGDTVLVCSDGLTKNGPNGQPYITEAEMQRVTRTQEGEKAARALVSFALGRNADDNVSAAVLQMPDPARRRRAQRPLYIAGGVIALLVLILIGSLFLFSNRSTQQENAFVLTQTAESIAAAATLNRVGNESTRVIAEQTQQAATLTAQPTLTPTPSPTVTPTPTARPALRPGEIGAYFQAGNRVVFTLADEINAQPTGLEIQVNHIGEGLENGNIYALPNTRLKFNSVNNDGIKLFLFEQGDIFLETGGYTSGASVTLREKPEVSFSVQGSCLSVRYTGLQEIAASCYEGTCSYSLEVAGAEIPIPVGQQLRLILTDFSQALLSRIPRAEADAYRRFLSTSSSGREDVSLCINPLFPTSTPTFTPTPTSTPRPQSSLTPSPTKPQTTNPTRSTVTNTPPSPTNTPPSPTNTPPSPTNTPPSPTNTPPPSPTNTPPPSPTNTPPSPTNTPPSPSPTPIVEIPIPIPTPTPKSDSRFPN